MRIFLTNPENYKKVIAVRLGFIYDQYRKHRVLPAITATLPGALVLVAWESYMTPSWPEYTKTPPQRGLYAYFLIENCLKQHFYIKTINSYTVSLIHFERNRSRLKIFLLQAILCCICSKFWKSYTPPAIWIRAYLCNANNILLIPHPRIKLFQKSPLYLLLMISIRIRFTKNLLMSLSGPKSHCMHELCA